MMSLLHVVGQETIQYGDYKHDAVKKQKIQSQQIIPIDHSG